MLRPGSLLIRRRLKFLAILCSVLGSALPNATADDAVSDAGASTENSQQSEFSVDAVEFFEARIRPVLVKHCYQCHAADSETVQGGLRLDTAHAIRMGGDSGSAIDIESPQESLLLSALRYEGLEMPPAGRLPDHVVKDFEVWIAAGAADPRLTDPPTEGESSPQFDIDEGRKFWAFQLPHVVEDLQLENASAVDSDRIDALIQRRLKDNNLNPNSEADRRSLIRRMTFDLTGLPPLPEDVAAFEADISASAIESLADRLLHSSAYGERWARMWLDVARYAEDQAHIVGNNKELFYPNAWRYREWVINAMNADMPYDRFVTLQLAADIVEPDDQNAHTALGFIGLGPKYYRRNDPEVMAEEWEDRVDVVARGLQGLTVVCARCHDHKYDPIPTEDYYALAGVFASTEMFNKPMEGRETGRNGHAKNPDESLHIIRDSQPRDLNVMIRGNVKNSGNLVPRGFLQVVFNGPRRTFHNGSGRAELAAAIVDSNNPLTARVIVNRIWQQYFSKGIVATPSNFGQLGDRPTHPELLDDLAARFMQYGWSLKWLHRQIVLSKTYQQSSALSGRGTDVDPENKLLWRMPRRRLSVEAWRDAVLAVSGRLDQSIGGPSIVADDPEQTRRTIYAEVSRFELNPLLARFDFPDPNGHSERRVETNTPLQKLFLLNNPFMMKQATSVAERIQQIASPSETSDNVQLLINTAFQLTLQRYPDLEELAVSMTFLKSNPETGLQQLAQSLLASNEFWWVD